MYPPRGVTLIEGGAKFLIANYFLMEDGGGISAI
jgi:hypothetical protein